MDDDWGSDCYERRNSELRHWVWCVEPGCHAQSREELPLQAVEVPFRVRYQWLHQKISSGSFIASLIK